MPNLDTIKNYLRIDYSEDDEQLMVLQQAAKSYIMGAVGEKYPKDDKRTEILTLLLISDMYDNRGTSEKAGINTRKLIDDICLQLRLECRKAVSS